MPLKKAKTTKSNSGGTYKTPSVLDVGSKIEPIPKKEINTTVQQEEE